MTEPIRCPICQGPTERRPQIDHHIEGIQWDGHQCTECGCWIARPDQTAGQEAIIATIQHAMDDPTCPKGWGRIT